jgi:hypothetical protein
MLPDRVPFSEVLLEVCRWTGFADAFTHLSEGRARAEDLHISICAVLLAGAGNYQGSSDISLSEVAQPSLPALSHNRLSWVSQNYVRAETIAAANEHLLGLYRRSFSSVRRIRRQPGHQQTDGQETADALVTTWSAPPAPSPHPSAQREDLADAFDRWYPGLMPAMDEQPLTA